jgi:ketosteroid isomerase-like protein
VTPDPKEAVQMAGSDHLQLAREMYGAYVSGNRRVVDRILSDDFEFFSPADAGIDRDRYFERCWPNSELIDDFDFKRLAEVGDEVIVTYESTKSDGSRFRNTEVLTFADGRLRRAEVYFGWNL